jgi:hypothetical protein
LPATRSLIFDNLNIHDIGGSSINLGGSTGFAYFRPPHATTDVEARNRNPFQAPRCNAPVGQLLTHSGSPPHRLQ